MNEKKHLGASERLRLWRLANPEKVKEAARKYYTKNKAKMVARVKQWKVDHPERAREIVLKSRLKHPKRYVPYSERKVSLQKSSKKWFLANKEKMHKANKKWSEVNKEKVKERKRVWRLKHLERERERNKNWKINNREKYLQIYNTYNTKQSELKQAASFESQVCALANIASAITQEENHVHTNK